MSFSFTKDSLDELKSRLDVVDVVGRCVQLKRAGANFKGLCPFHNEKTPSFVVSPQKQIFTCFGCGASGDAVAFTMKYYNLEFGEAVQKLAGEYGVELQTTASRADDRDKYYEINREAARFFYRQMTEGANPGYTYMKSRGIEDRTIKKFGLGYAPAGWDNLYGYFRDKGVEEKLLVELGLLSQKDGRYYDKFRNRVIFPIINVAGKVIGFGGRALDAESTPKYLNSPENRVFQKKNNLYALNSTRQEIGKAGSAIIVEGYMDVISLYQHGVKNVAASLGTALTENQAKLINRYTKNVVLSYDADAAGQNAALRGIEVLRKENCKVKVLHVTDGKDPDEYIKKNGQAAFLARVDKALPYVEYKLSAAGRGLDLASEDGKVDYMRRISSVLADLSPIEADIYIKKIARDTEISEGAIRMEILGNNNRQRPAANQRAERPQEAASGLSRIEATVLKCIFTDPKLSEVLLPYVDVFESELGKKVVNLAFEAYGLRGDFDAGLITDRLDPGESRALEESLASVVLSGNEKDVLKQCVHKWNYDRLKKEEEKIIDMLTLADAEKNEKASRELSAKLMRIRAEMEAHGGKI